MDLLFLLYLLQSKAELSTKLEKAEQMKSKIFQLEEENDEVQNFTTQELYKVKHMVCLLHMLFAIYG